MFSWSLFETIGILSSPLPQGCMWGFGLFSRVSFGNSGWHTVLLFLLCVFTLGLYQGLGMGIVKGSLLLLDISWMKVVTLVRMPG